MRKNAKPTSNMNAMNCWEELAKYLFDDGTQSTANENETEEINDIFHSGPEFFLMSFSYWALQFFQYFLLTVWPDAIFQQIMPLPAAAAASNSAVILFFPLKYLTNSYWGENFQEENSSKKWNY